jgi:cyclopropane-fatty-acyl-phospholipid synthase
MSNQHQAATRRFAPDRSRCSLVSALVQRCFPQLICGRLVIDMPAGDRLIIEGDRPGPQARLTVHRLRCLWRLIVGGEVGFADSYIAGDWSTPDLVALMRFGLSNARALTRSWWRRWPRPLARLRHARNRNTRRGSRRNIAAHYDLGNEFYAHWLDVGMSYSAALFTKDAQTLEEAQNAKLDRVFELLDITEGQRVLEIGCGWGGLAERIVERFRCHLTGLTLSQRQLVFACRRLRERGLLNKSDLRLQDYRDVSETYDRIVSIEMLEAVGEAYWPTYFAKLRAALRWGGTAVIHVITIDEARFETYRRRPDFIQHYIFPGGMLPTVAIVKRQIAAAGLQLVSSESFGPSYARTLAEWQRRFQQTWPAIAALGFDERFKRTWEYYLSYCQAGFEAGTVSVGLYKIAQCSA